MKKMSKKVLVLVLTAVLFMSNLSFTVSAHDNNPPVSGSTIKVSSGDRFYIDDATVTMLPAPYSNNTYVAYCADKDENIDAGYVYNTIFSIYNNNKIAYLINNNLSTDKKVIQQLIWRILNGSYESPSNSVKNAANAIYQQYFQNASQERYWDFHSFSYKYKTVYTDKPDSAFPSASSSEYSKTIFLANSSTHRCNVQPILVVVPKQLTVTFNYDGKTASQVVGYGQNATEPADSQKEGYDLTWDKTFTNVKTDLVVNGSYAIKKFNVTFIYGLDGAKTASQVVNYNGSATEPADAVETGHTYTWDKAYTNITSNTTVNAIYADIHFTVKFFDFDGAQIGDTQDVIYGQPASDVPHPTKDGYEFIEWDTTFDSVKGNLEIHPIYSTYFTVTFVGFNNENLGSVRVAPEGTATAPVLQPVAGHTFQGWDTELSPITENVTVTAIYTTNQYNVTFMDTDTTVWGTPQLVAYEGAAVAPEVNPSQVGKTFVGWDVPFNFITSDLTVSAVYTPNVYTVVFVDYNEQVLGTDSEVLYGHAATAPETTPSRSGYNFTGWDKDFFEVTTNLTVAAVYTQIPAPTPVAPTYYNVTVSKTGEGTVQTGSFQVQSGDFIIGSIVPADGYKLDSITGANGSEVTVLDGTYRISVNAAKEIIVNFVSTTVEVPEVVVPETIVPEAAPEVTASATTAAPVQEEVILDATETPQGGLPNTGGLPIGLPVIAGSLTAAFGFIVRKLNNKDEE